jgi:mono/diheme cytochrome c family protein
MSKTWLMGLVLVCMPVATMAQGAKLGAQEFANSCAQCHGISAKGDGVMVEFLSTPAPDLTQIQKNNDGVFPVAALFDVIQGSSIPGAHGTGEMPAWGNRYTAKAPSQLGEMYSQADQQAFAQGRILALIEYISTLQEK